MPPNALRILAARSGLLLLFLGLFAQPASPAQPPVLRLTGCWQGRLQIGPVLQVVLEIRLGGPGGGKGSARSRDPSAIAIASIAVTGSQVAVILDLRTCRLPDRSSQT